MKPERWARCGALFLLLAAVGAPAQTTAVTASALKMGGTPVSAGVVTLLPVDANGKAIPIVGASSLNGPMGFRCSIAAGAITGTCTVPDACLATPPNIGYTVTVMNTATNQAFTMAKVANVCGTSWALDAYAPPAQTTNMQPLQSSGGPNAPTGACNEPAIYLRSGTSNSTYICNAGSWVQTSGSGGGASFPTAAASGQLLTSTAAGASPSTAWQGQIFYSQAGDTIASIEAKCSVACTYVVTVPQTITLAADHAMSSNVHLDFTAGGKWTVNGTYTLSNIQVEQSSVLSQHFAGSATLALANTPRVPLEWFGGVADGVLSTGAGTDNAPAFTKAIAAMPSGEIVLGVGIYTTHSTVTVAKSSVDIRGQHPGYAYNGVSPAPPASIIASTSASSDILAFTGTDASHPLLWNRISNVSLHRTVLPTGTAKGLSLNYTCGVRVENVQSNDSVSAFYAHSAPACSVGGFFSTQASWGLSVVPISAYTSGAYIGYDLDSEDGASESTLILNNAGFASPSLMPGGTSKGVSLHGAAINDVNGFQVGGAFVNIGIDISYDGVGTEGTGGDIHFIQPILDTSIAEGIKISSIPLSAGRAGIEIDGGLITAAGKAIEIQSTSVPVFVRGAQIFTQGSSAGAVLVNSSQNVNLLNNSILGGNPSTPTYLVSFVGSSNGKVQSNQFIGRSGFAPTSMLTLTSTSINNAINSNTYGGYGTNAITLDSTSQTNSIGPEMVDTTHITTAYNGFTTQTTDFPRAITCAGASCASGSNYSGVTGLYTGTAGNQETGIRMGATIPCDVVSVINQQGGILCNAFYNGSAWVSPAGVAAPFVAFRLLAAPGDDSGKFQLALGGSHAAGGTISTMDSTDVTLFGRQGKIWINPQIVDPAFPTGSVLVAGSTAGFWTDDSGNVTVAGGGNTLYRCTTAGALPVGALTTATGNCGASVDTGLRVH